MGISEDEALAGLVRGGGTVRDDPEVLLLGVRLLDELFWIEAFDFSRGGPVW